MQEINSQPLSFTRYGADEMKTRADDFLAELKCRRSVRDFSTAAIPLDVVRTCIETANSAPNGANKQPWTFVLVTSLEKRRAIRVAAEKEEALFYGGRASSRWLDDLEHLATHAEKRFLEDAPALIVVFAQKSGPPTADGKKGDQHYYVNESVGLACGFLIAALHHAGLATLTYTPSPIAFLSKILERPSHERPFLLLPVGVPTEDCRVPIIEKKNLSDVLIEV